MIVALQGGLSNTLWQVCFGLSTAKARNEEVLFTRFRVDQDKKRSYSLDAFNFDLKFTTHEPEPYIYDMNYDSAVYRMPNPGTFIGYWQNYLWWNGPLIKEQLSLRNTPSPRTLELAEQIGNDNTAVSIHVRRGDYVTEEHTKKFHGLLGPEYYDKAIQHFQSRIPDAKFYVFSDDPEWCRQQFPEAIIVDHNKPGNGQRAGDEWQDLYLMSQFQNCILANSAFSMFAACWSELYKDCQVVAPAKWFADPNTPNPTLSDDWVRM